MKSRINITIDERLHAQAKAKGINLSSECERILKQRFCAKLNDAPQESIYLKCGTCGHLFNDGYLCELDGRCICLYCHGKDKCKHQDHFHIRVPGLSNENLNILKKYVQDGSIDRIDPEIEENSKKDIEKEQIRK